jgi:hypothetical protein
MTDLTDKMRTCAAHIMSRPHDAPMPTEHLLDDAAKLLNDAADLLEATSADLHPIALGEPMEILPPAPPSEVIQPPPPVVGPPQWFGATDQLRFAGEIARKSNACPVCDSRSGKRVRVMGQELWLMCACGASWQKLA